uniref:Uncharacterized protein n=1 Tax=Candidatus Kentrum sp. TUN TaxID=2126343 RepID=A0A450ZXS1_9GAMM|nr:MAG: hypothetical protein BECKTUN1418D_GA0071000_10861 [Candidatus Kentron sp. TUN]
MTSLLVWLLSVLGALSFFAAGYLLARVRAVSLRQKLDKHKERLGEAEKRVEWLEERQVGFHEKQYPQENGKQVDHSSESIKKTSLLPIPSIPNVPGGLGNSLETFLEVLSRNIEGCQAAVFADEQGFPVAGIGEYEENLAIIAAACNEVSDRISNILPFGKLQEMRMIDENGLVAAVYSVPIDRQWLTLVLLSVGDSPKRKVVKRFIKDYLPEIIGEGRGR